ncbi:MAG: hypothetical protein ABIR62_09275 [Dokdonella sp.]|uniref:hypothetical protein n=1 Tax=Dokdonella sp. TaxID=2291710 RepID=UPI00326496E6
MHRSDGVEKKTVARHFNSRMWQGSRQRCVATAGAAGGRAGRCAVAIVVGTIQRALIAAAFAVLATPVACSRTSTDEQIAADNDVNFDNGRGPGRWAQPRIDFEILLAPGAVVPTAPDSIRVSLDSDKGSIDADLQSSVGRDSSGRAVLRGSVMMTHRARDRLIVIRMVGQPDRVCASGLAADPPGTDVAGAWRECTMVFDAGATTARRPRAIEATQFRYTVWRPPVWRDAIH